MSIVTGKKVGIDIVTELFGVPLLQCCSSQNMHLSENRDNMQIRLICQHCHSAVFTDLYDERKETQPENQWNQMIKDRDKEKESLDNYMVNKYPYPWVY